MAKDRKSKPRNVLGVVNAGVKGADEERRSDQRSEPDHDRDQHDHERV